MTTVREGSTIYFLWKNAVQTLRAYGVMQWRVDTACRSIFNVCCGVSKNEMLKIWIQDTVSVYYYGKQNHWTIFSDTT